MSAISNKSVELEFLVIYKSSPAAGINKKVQCEYLTIILRGRFVADAFLGHIRYSRYMN